VLSTNCEMDVQVLYSKLNISVISCSFFFKFSGKTRVNMPNIFANFLVKTPCVKKVRYCVLDKNFLHPSVKTNYCSLRVRCGPKNSKNSWPIDFKFSGLMPVCTKTILVNFFCKTPIIKKVMAFKPTTNAPDSFRKALYPTRFVPCETS